MDRERGFSFKLLVPPRVSHGQVSAVKPQEIIDKNTGFQTPMQEGFTKSFNKKQQHLSNKSIFAPTKPNIQDCVKMKVVSPMEKEDYNSGQLYTKMFDEIEKIKCWKVKIDSDTVQKERKLFENKRTIETQRKAIQELQFGNESLSIKLEEQISENDELRNRDNATRNLCNILKDTFERSVEKMHLFECEREETHHLLLEHHDMLQKQTEAFETLDFKAEANKGELLKAKEELMQFEDLKIKLQQEYNMKEEEVEGLLSKLRDNDEKLNNILLDLEETKAQSRILQEEIDQKSLLVTSSTAEYDSLCKKLQEVELRCSETEQANAALVAKSEETARIIQSKDLNLQELSKEKTLQTERLGLMQVTVNEQKKSLAAETQKTHELKDRVATILAELEKTKSDLGETRQLSGIKQEQINRLIEQLDLKTESMESLSTQMVVISGRVEKLTSELLNKTEEARTLKEVCDNAGKDLEELKAKFTFAQVQAEELQTHLNDEKKENEKKTSEIFQLQGEITHLNCDLASIKASLYNKCQEMETLKKDLEENSKNLQDELSKKERKIRVVEAKNKALEKQMAKETVKTAEQLDTINNLEEGSKNLKRIHEEESQKLLQDLENKSASARELETEVQKLRLEAEEAIRCQEDAELKCQSKIADMVLLMEKHKNQYDRMVQEKDAELEANKEKEMKAIALGKSLKQEFSKQKKEIDSLKKEVKDHMKEKENLEKELIELKNKVKDAQITRENKQLPISDDKKEEVLKTPVDSLLKLYRFDFSKAMKTPSSTKDDWAATVGNICTQGSVSTSVRTSCRTTPKSTGHHSEAKTPKNKASRSTSKIKSYRIRTPPSTEKKSTWEKDTIELDPKSDSSELLMFVNTSAEIVPASHSIDNMFRKSQSSLILKSPKNNVKLAAMKRMRDAGWTAVSGNEKKKKTNEKIFA